MYFNASIDKEISAFENYYKIKNTFFDDISFFQENIFWLKQNLMLITSNYLYLFFKLAYINTYWLIKMYMSDQVLILIIWNQIDFLYFQSIKKNQTLK
jgi:hypothetical protein